MSKSKSTMGFGVNLILIFALLAVACNLSGTTTKPTTTPKPSLPTQVAEAPPTAEPTAVATAEAAPPTQTTAATSQPTEVLPTAEPTVAAPEEAAEYTPDARLAFASFAASPVQVQTYASGVNTAPAWENVYNPSYSPPSRSPRCRPTALWSARARSWSSSPCTKRRAMPTNPSSSPATRCCIPTICFRQDLAHRRNRTVHPPTEKPERFHASQER